ncbi:MAG TPA: tetratricopeptide repeat protein [Chthoniobacterales bacterium]|jgi:tetratricopeptide (TPR) repeat protein
MPEEFQFRFSFTELPPPGAEAVTVSEAEQSLLKTLDARGGKCPDSLWSLAGLYQRGGDFDKASECIQRYMELTDDPEEIGAGHLALGGLEEGRGDYTAAAQRYRAALSMEPCSTKTWYFIHNNLGYSLNQIKEYSSAIPYLRTALEIDPGRPNAYKNLGLAYEALGDLEQAAELFITATQVNAADSRSLQHLISLVDANPALEVDIPNLRERIEACEKAVEVARQHKPDWDKYWDRLRAKQKRKWWQFWRRRTDATKD